MIQEAYVHGVSTRSVDDLVKAMGAGCMSKSRVSRLCAEIDERVRDYMGAAAPIPSAAGHHSRLRSRGLPSQSSV